MPVTGPVCRATFVKRMEAWEKAPITVKALRTLLSVFSLLDYHIFFTLFGRFSPPDSYIKYITAFSSDWYPGTP
jgi:hypothetical protein